MFLWPPREDFNEPRGKRQSEGEGSNHKKQRVGAVHEDPVDQKDQNGDTALDQIVKNVTGNPDEATLCTLSTLLRYSKVIELETKDRLGRILPLAVESGPIEPTKQFIKSLVRNGPNRAARNIKKHAAHAGLHYITTSISLYISHR